MTAFFWRSGITVGAFRNGVRDKHKTSIRRFEMRGTYRVSECADEQRVVEELP